MSGFGKRLTMMFVLSVTQASPLWADEGDVFNLTASASSLWDSNLFRLPEAADPKSDTLNTFTAGLNFNKAIGLQRLIANVSVVDYRYQRFDYLDFVALNYDARWLWALGSRWTGEASFARSQLPNDYTQDRTLGRRNVQTSEIDRFETNYWFHPEWVLLAGVLRMSITNQIPVRADGDYTANGYNLGLRFLGAPGNRLTAQAVHLEGNYEKRPFNSVFQFDNGFTQDNYRLDFEWLATGHSQFRGRIEYLDRQYEHFSQRDYAGWAGNLQYTYTYSDKTVFSLGYTRGLEAYQVLTSSYYVLDEVAAGVRWSATSTITVNGRASYARQAYRGSLIPLPAGVEQREDRTSTLALDLTYQPARWLQFKVGGSVAERSSNYEAFTYRDRTAFVSLTAQY